MQPSRIHHVGLPVSDLDLSVAWYREALGLTRESTAGVPGGVAFMVALTGERLELLAMDVQPSAWDDPIAALRAGVPHTAWTVDDLDAAHARAVEAGGRSVWTPRDTPDPAHAWDGRAAAQGTFPNTGPCECACPPCTFLESRRDVEKARLERAFSLRLGRLANGQLPTGWK
jgi:catechol 2,3-dioxygenase-like lactoylglutathione lyase family enzyme